MKKCYLLLILLLLSCSIPGRNFEVGEVKIEVPHGWEVDGPKNKDSIIEQLTITNSDGSAVSVICFEVQVDLETSINFFKYNAEIGGNANLLTVGDFKPHTFNDEPALISELRSTIDGKQFVGQVIAVNTNNQSILILAMHPNGIGIDIEQKILKSVQLIEKAPTPLNEMVDKIIRLQNKSLPKLFDGIIYYEVSKYGDNDIRHFYALSTDVTFSKSELEQLKSEIKDSHCEELKDIADGSIRLWFDAGNTVSYHYSDNNGKELFLITVTKEDIN